MEPPTIVEKPGIKIAGAGCAFVHILSPDCNTGETIFELWGRFGETSARIANRVDPDTCYGIVWGKPADERSHPDELQYISGAEVTSFDDQPDDLVTFEVPAGTYAVFVHEGSMEKIGETVGYAFREWLPNSDHEYGGICDVEHYDERFCGDDPAASVMEYWIPVRLKAEG